MTKCRYRKQDYQYVVRQLGEKVVFYKMVSYHALAFAPTITGLEGRMPSFSWIQTPYVGLFGLFCLGCLLGHLLLFINVCCIKFT